MGAEQGYLSYFGENAFGSALAEGEQKINGGERGIRTLGTLARTTVFETAPFDRSGISPHRGKAAQAMVRQRRAPYSKPHGRSSANLGQDQGNIAAPIYPVSGTRPFGQTADTCSSPLCYTPSPAPAWG